MRLYNLHNLIVLVNIIGDFLEESGALDLDNELYAAYFKLYNKMADIKNKFSF